MINYDDILKTQKSSKALPIEHFSKSHNIKIDDVLSHKSEDIRRTSINRDNMIFGSVSQRDVPNSKHDKMNHS